MPGVPRDDDALPDDDPLDPAVLGPHGESTEDLLDELLQSDRWPDEPDDDDPLPPPQRGGASPVDLLVDDAPEDDAPELEVPITEEAPLPSLADEAVVIPWRSEVLVDGVPTPTIADPTQPGSTLSRPEPTAARQKVAIRYAGLRFALEVHVVPGEDRLRLGRDALRKRFVVSADND